MLHQNIVKEAHAYKAI